MDELSATTAVGLLMGGFAYPWSDDNVQTWTTALMAIDWPGADDDAMTAGRTMPGAWGEKWPPQLADFIDAIGREHARRVQRDGTLGIPASRVHCDGSGWKRGAGGQVPCPRCSPALASIWDDDRRRQYLDGTPLEDLTSLVQRRRGQLEWGDGVKPPRCGGAFDTVVPPSIGISIAAKHYKRQCDEDGREPNWDLFDAALGGKLPWTDT